MTKDSTVNYIENMQMTELVGKSAKMIILPVSHMFKK